MSRYMEFEHKPIVFHPDDAESETFVCSVCGCTFPEEEKVVCAECEMIVCAKDCSDGVLCNKCQLAYDEKWRQEEMKVKSTSIAWRAEDANIPRHMRRQEEKRKKKGEDCLMCPSCGYIEFGRKPVKVMITPQHEPLKIYRKCPSCGVNLTIRRIKENERKKRK